MEYRRFYADGFRGEYLSITKKLELISNSIFGISE
jgi:hypothetical protein